MASYISATNVNLTFAPKNRAPVNALYNFNVDVQEGEFVSIVGPSGCGKSTFLNALLGLIPPNSGEMAISGKKISGPGQDRAMVFQEFGLLPWRTVEDNIGLGLELRGIAEAKRKPVSLMRRYLGIAPCAVIVRTTLGILYESPAFPLLHSVRRTREG